VNSTIAQKYSLLRIGLGLGFCISGRKKRQFDKVEIPQQAFFVLKMVEVISLIN
jgi:hypothetical protein